MQILDKHGNPYPVSTMATGFETTGATGDYEAATTGLRLGNWGLSSAGPNAALSGPLHALRSRCRATVRNNPVASGGVDSFVSNLVGTDISPRWEDLEDSILKEQLQTLWADSQEELDANGVYDFYGQVEQVAMAQMDAGEALGRYRPRLPSDGLLVPLQIQLLGKGKGDRIILAVIIFPNVLYSTT